MKKSALVVGGMGYVGTKLSNSLVERGIRVTVFDTGWFGNPHSDGPNLKVHYGDVREPNSYPEGFFDFVFHLANIANDPSVDLDPSLSWEVNVLGTQYLLDWVRKMGCSRFVFASSGSVYGISGAQYVTEAASLVPVSVYNKTKMVAERVCLSYQDDFPVVIVRPATVCGLSPRMRFDTVVNLLTLQAWESRKITVFGGNQTRPNVHIDDLVSALNFLALDAAPPGIYNVGFENLTVSEIANSISEKLGSEIQFMDSNDPRSYRVDSSKLLSLGYRPRYGVQYAIDEIVDALDEGRVARSPQSSSVDWLRSLISNGLG